MLQTGIPSILGRGIVCEQYSVLLDEHSQVTGMPPVALSEPYIRTPHDAVTTGVGRGYPDDLLGCCRMM
jgi:hypothetical protein